MKKTVKKVNWFGSDFYIDLENKTLSSPKKGFQLGMETIGEAYASYKGVNIVHRPGYILIAQQFLLKNRDSKILVIQELTAEEFKAVFTPFEILP